MSGMVERVAKAIYEKRNGAGCKPWSRQPWAHKQPYVADARAAIEAMREPTEAMIDAFGAAFYTDWHQISADPIYREQARKGIAAAISGALNEEG